MSSSIPPVLMIVFNRPDHARKVFEKVKAVQPKRLYVAVDGPRRYRPDDEFQIKETVKIFNEVNWPCEVIRLVRPENLGCRLAVSSAITWFFDHEEQGIILEDDCVPDASFFTYSDYLLNKYKDTQTVMHINGVNFQDGHWRGTGSYYFSRICHVWGWASWRRAWDKYDINMEGMEEFFEHGLYKNILTYKEGGEYWKNALTQVKNGLIDTWDYQWAFSVWKNNGLSLSPNFNLISNIGFDEHATHTRRFDPRVSDKPLNGVDGTVNDPTVMVADYYADLYSFNKLFIGYQSDIVSRVKRKILSLAK
jgi:hypothetical protein